MTIVYKSYKEDIRARFLTAMRLILFERRKDCKTVTRFAEMIGEYQQNISKIERGERYPTLDHVARLCEIFDYSTDWLILGRGSIEDTAESNTEIETLKSRMDTIEKEINQIKKYKK